MSQVSTSPTTSPSLSDRSNLDIVVLALYLISPIGEVDTEDIAMRCQAISPGRFSWRKHPAQVDLERVRVRLSEGLHDGFVFGSHAKGWRITSKGALYVQEQLVSLVRGKAAKPTVRQGDARWRAAETKRLLQTPAYRKFAAGFPEKISHIEIGEFFRIDSYTSDSDRKAKLDRYRTAFHQHDELRPVITRLSNIVLQGASL